MHLSTYQPPSLSLPQALHCHPNLFALSDFTPLTLPRPSLTPPTQRTPFQPNTSWLASSTLAVLDALPLSRQAHLEHSLPLQTALSYTHLSASTPLPADMADLFASAPLRPPHAGGGELPVFVCDHCARPVLSTRFISHIQSCEKGGCLNDSDDQLALIVAPYGECPREEDVEVVNERKRKLEDFEDILSVEDDWEHTLDPVEWNEYVPRGKFVKKRRVSVEAGARRKGVEREAVQTALAMGMGGGEGGPLRTLAGCFGEGVEWAKLMQIAMPVVVERVPKRRKDGVLEVRGGGKVEMVERGRASLVEGLMYLRGLGMRDLAHTPLGQMDTPQMVVGRKGTVFHSQTYVAELGTFQTDPRPAGSITLPLTSELMIVEGKEANADISAGEGTSVGGGSTVSGGEKNKKAKMQKGNNNVGSGAQGNSKKQRTVKGGQRGAPTAGGVGVASAQQTRGKPATPRKSGGSRSSAGGAGKCGTSSQDSQPQPQLQPQPQSQPQSQPQPKLQPQPRQQPQPLPLPQQQPQQQLQQHQEQHQRQHQRQAQQQAQHQQQQQPQRQRQHQQKGRSSVSGAGSGGGGSGMTAAMVSAALSSASMAAMNKFGSAQQMSAQQMSAQKKGSRQMNGGASGGLSRDGSAQSLPAASTAAAVGHANVKGNARGASKGRQTGIPVTSTPSIGMRSGAKKVVKTPSPSQASSKSGDRLALHRGSPTSATMFEPALMASTMNQMTAGINRDAASVRGAPGNSQLDFQQVLAQFAGQNGRIPGAGLGMNNVARGAIPQTASKGQLPSDKSATQLARAANLRGIPHQARIKQNALAQNVQARLAQMMQARQEGTHGPLSKDDRDLLQKTSELDAHLRRGEGLNPEMIAARRDKIAHAMIYGKHLDRRNINMNPMAQHSQGFYNAVVEPPNSQIGTNALTTQQQQQTNLGFFPMTHQNQLNAAAAPNPGAGAPSTMQNMHDVRSLHNLGVIPPGLPANPAHNANTLSFLQAAGLGPGPTNTGAMNSPAMAGIPANIIPPAPPTTSNLNTETFLQQLLSAAAPSSINPNAPAIALHGHHIGAPTGPLNQAHQAGRTGSMALMPPTSRPGQAPSQNSAIDEIDRALGLVDEGDRID